MGSNIHIQALDEEKELKPFPDGLTWDKNTCTLPRYAGYREFMGQVFRLPYVRKERCGCLDIYDEHDYYCDRDLIVRPKNFKELRKRTEHLGEWASMLIDYLEQEPNAALEIS